MATPQWMAELMVTTPQSEVDYHVASSTPSQGSRQGSIAAVLPGSSITVVRQAPRVRSTSVSHKPVPQRSDSHEADGGFEL